jgi:hypothetical protein
MMVAGPKDGIVWVCFPGAIAIEYDTSSVHAIRIPTEVKAGDKKITVSKIV